MPMHFIQLRSWLSRVGPWAREQIVVEVPADLAVCEFDCRQPACSSEEWATCQRRISKAAGELMPWVQHEHTVRTVETDRELVGTI